MGRLVEEGFAIFDDIGSIGPEDMGVIVLDKEEEREDISDWLLLRVEVGGVIGFTVKVEEGIGRVTGGISV